MFGLTCLCIAFLTSCIAGCMFYFSPKSRYGKGFYYSAATAIISAAGYLLWIILTDRFNYAYVFSYSSRDLSLIYKLSVFWAGQEGSFLLWLLIHAVIGVVLIHRHDLSAGAMAIYSVLQAGLTSLLLIKSPFALVPVKQTEGMGLNPLLQDPWMVIHPPLIFIGYAILAVPLAGALHGLAVKEHRDWLKRSLLWLVIGWMFLGAGIFVGGFWAYKVLGWGGYWAWDPVENSSLVPWLMTGAAVHTLLLARQRPGIIRYAYAIVILTYTSVLYGTFLTRSGVLSNFSTHSFADEGTGAILAAYLLIVFAGSFVLLIWRWPNLPLKTNGELYRGRSFVLILTAGIFFTFAFIVFIGMSVPLFTLAFGKPQSVNTVFYNRAALPLAAALGGLLSIGFARQFSRWLSRLMWFTILAFTIVGYSLGLKQPLIAMTFALAAGACLVNFFISYKRYISRAAGLAHVGTAVLLAGILVSSSASQTVTLAMTPLIGQEVFNKSIVYQGQQDTGAGDRITRHFAISDSNKTSDLLQAVTRFDAHGRTVNEPAIYRSLFADLYLTPLDAGDQEEADEIKLAKDEAKVVNGVTIKFLRLNVTGVMGGDMQIKAILEVTKDGRSEQVVPELNYRPREITAQPLRLWDKYDIRLAAIYPGTGNIGITVRDAEQGNLQPVNVEVIHKPLINLVWLGAVLIVCGTAWAAAVRVKALGVTDSVEAKQIIVKKMTLQ